MTRIAVASLVFALPSVARADGPYEGDWRSGSMRIEVAVESWGGDCGPRPQSTTAPGGQTFHVTQSGDDLTFQGRPQRTTRGCWSENPSVRRVSSRYQAGTWTIVCRTPEEDPRAEVGTYTLRAASDSRIEFRDVSRYDWQLNESRCVATITSTQSFDRVGGAPTPQPEPEPTPTPTPEPPRPEPPRAEPACTPGAPARIAIRPAQAELEPGGRACFQVRVVDASGCAVPGRQPSLELRAPAGATGRLRASCFEAPSSAAEAEGEYVIVARDGSFEEQARVRVRTPDLSDLIARRAEGGGAVSLTGGDSATSEEAARVAARGEAERPSMVAPLIGGAVALLLVVIATVGLLSMRSRRRASTLPAAPETLPAPAVAAGDPKICPTCRRGYPPDAQTCSRDGTPLVKYADFTASAASAAAATHVCPKCGTRYPKTTRFCGKDGATLVDG